MVDFANNFYYLNYKYDFKEDKGSISMNNNVMTITLNNSTPITPDYHIDWKVSSSVKTNFTVSGITYSS